MRASSDDSWLPQSLTIGGQVKFLKTSDAILVRLLVSRSKMISDVVSGKSTNRDVTDVVAVQLKCMRSSIPAMHPVASADSIMVHFPKCGVTMEHSRKTRQGVSCSGCFNTEESMSPIFR